MSFSRVGVLGLFFLSCLSCFLATAMSQAPCDCPLQAYNGSAWLDVGFDGNIFVPSFNLSPAFPFDADDVAPLNQNRVMHLDSFGTGHCFYSLTGDSFIYDLHLGPDEGYLEIYSTAGGASYIVESTFGNLLSGSLPCHLLSTNSSIVWPERITITKTGCGNGGPAEDPNDDSTGGSDDDDDEENPCRNNSAGGGLRAYEDYAGSSQGGLRSYDDYLASTFKPQLSYSRYPVVFSTGVVREAEVDLAVATPVFDFRHSRNYNSLRMKSGGGEINELNGLRWQTTIQGPYLTTSFTTHPGGGNPLLHVNYYPDAYSKHTFDEDSGDYTPPASLEATLTPSGSGANEIFTLEMTRTGKVFIFYGFASQIDGNLRGRLKERTNRRYVTEGLSGTEYSYSNGRLVQITTAEPQSWSIEYTYLSSEVEPGRLQKIEVKNGSNAVIKKAEYRYAGEVSGASADLGTLGDLVQVKLSNLSSDNTTWKVRTTQYRYYTNASTNGKNHQLKMVLEPDAIEQINNAGNSDVDTPEELLTKSDSYPVVGSTQLAAYANRSFTYYTSDENTSAALITPWGSQTLGTLYGGANLNEYDSLAYGRVKTEIVNGSCSSCSGGSGDSLKYTYYYMSQNGGSSTNPTEVNAITVEDVQTATGTPLYRNIYGLNHKHQELRNAKIEDPTAGTLKVWCKSTTLNNNYNITQRRSPAAHTLIDSNGELEDFLNPTGSSGGNDTSTLNSSEGLIEVFEYDGNNNQTASLVKKGSSGTAYYVAGADYGDGTSTPTYLMTASHRYPTQVAKATPRPDGIKTTYAYTFWDGAGMKQVQKRTTTQAAVDTTQNGPGSSIHAVTEDCYDRLGRLRWTKDALGYVNYYSYQPDTGGLAYQALDVNPSDMPDSVNDNDNNPLTPSPWVPATDDGSGLSYGSGGIPSRSGAITDVEEMVTTNEYDSLGRRIKTVVEPGEPHERVHYTVYEPNRTISIPHWNGLDKKAGLPTSVSVTNNAGQLRETYAVSAAYSSFLTEYDTTAATYTPKGLSGTINQSNYVSWTRYGYEPFTNRLSQVDRYHNIPDGVNVPGTLSTNFDRTINKYDNRGRLSHTIQTISGTSTSNGKEQFTERIYDVLDRVIEIKMGVSSSSVNYELTPPTMTTISKTIYDDGLVGNSYVTKTQKHFGTGSNDYTGVKIKRTYRGHVRGQEPFSGGIAETAASPFPVVDLDWEGKTTASAQYRVTAPTWATVLTGDGYTAFASSTSTNRVDYSETVYDNLGRRIRSKMYAVNGDTGALGAHLLTDYYYDLAGQLVASAPASAAATETAYDALGRAYQTRTVLTLNSSKYTGTGGFQYRAPQPKPGFSSSSPSAMSGGNEKVVTIDHSVYDDIGNVTESHHFNNYHDQINGIDLSGTSDYFRTSTYSWYDDQDRLTTTGEYGSGTAVSGDVGTGTYKYAPVPSRPDTAPSSSSDTRLVTTYSYEPDTGRTSITTSPQGHPTKRFYDDFGRTTFVAENFQNFVASDLSGISDGSDASKDRVTQTTYDGLGNTTTLVAYNGSSTADKQTTTYLYEDTRNARWVTNTIYPNSTDTTSSGNDQVKVTYNVDGTIATRTDQREVIISYSYDGRRRPTAQRVTDTGDAGQNVDSRVLSITTGYNSSGLPVKITSHGNSTSSSSDVSDVKNQVTYSHNDLDQVTYDFQAHAGVVVSGGVTPSSLASYDLTASSGVMTNNARPRQLTYPNARQLFYNYTESAQSGTQEFYDLMNMPRSLRESTETGTAIVNYRHTGDGTLVKALYNQPEVVMDLQQSSVNSYEGLDRFGRVKRQQWYDYTSGTVYRSSINYTYDYDSNRTSAEDTIAANNSKNYDEKYSYDGLNRLTQTQRGNLSGGSIASKNFEEDYSLDQLNNWAAYYRDLNGDGTDDLEQTRIHNKDNEITSIGASVGTNWADPTYDAAGNMVTCPKPNDPANSFTLRWDAWNRLVKVLDGANTVAEYEYDGMNRRIVKKLYTGGSLTQTRHRYHAPGKDQVIEERVDASSNADRQFTWGTRYVDDLVMRTRDTNADGTLDETLYALTDITYDVVALTDATGAVIERFLYDPYGKSTVLDANFALDSDGISDYDWEYRFTSREFDKETELDYFRARYYSSGQGRFVNRDPLGYPDGMNTYAGYFVPKGLDPFGLEDPNDYENPYWELYGYNPLNWCVNGAYGGLRVGYDYCYGNFADNSEVEWREREAEILGDAIKPQWQNCIRDQDLCNIRERNQKPVPDCYNHLIQEVELKAAGQYGSVPFGPIKPHPTFSPGKYAGGSIPARSSSKCFTADEIKKVNELGNKYGCHTCGAKTPGTASGTWYKDHQPVSTLNTAGQPQSLYPHCKKCSCSQGGSVPK